jgi:UDP-glucose:(heptosyl)LPS alpha-1,3-glucosyltransferase
MNAANMPHRPDPVKHALPRRLIFVRQQFTPYGGGELILDRMLSALAARGVRLALLGRAWKERAGVEFIHCDPPRFPRFLRERRFARAACRRLAGETGALVQSHERIPCCDIFRAGDGVHAAFLHERTRDLRRDLRAALMLHPFHRSILALEREMFASPRLQVVLANSKMVADEIEKYFGFPRDRIRLVPNGIDLDRFNPGARERYRADQRRRLQADDKRPIILFVGSGYKRKGLDTAIAAIATGKFDVELWIIGSDRQPARYARLAEHLGLSPSRLRLIGPVADTLSYYAAADMLILPSVYDPFPSTVIEALACGLPVVTSTACGARDAVARLDPRLVRDARDAAGLAEAIHVALSLASRPDTIGRARAIAAEYDVDRMLDHMLDVYSDMAAGARA